MSETPDHPEDLHLLTEPDDKTPTESVLAFFSAEGFGTALREAGLSLGEIISIVADIARRGKTDVGRLAAIKMLFERAETVARMSRLISDETTKRWAVDGMPSGPLSLTSVETHRQALTDSVARTEEELRRNLSMTTDTNRQLMPPDGDIIDAEPITDAPEETPNE